MPELVPSVKDVVPAGFTQVVLAAGEMPMRLAIRRFSSFTLAATFSRSIPSCNTLPEAIPVSLSPPEAG